MSVIRKNLIIFFVAMNAFTANSSEVITLDKIRDLESRKHIPVKITDRVQASKLPSKNILDAYFLPSSSRSINDLYSTNPDNDFLYTHHGSSIIREDLCVSISDSDVKLETYQRRHRNYFGKPLDKVIIYFNGNGTSEAEMSQDIVSFLLDHPERNITFISFNYRTVGLSRGYFNGFDGLVDDGLAQVQRILESDPQLSPNSILLFGHSLGGAVATTVAYKLKKSGNKQVRLLNSKSFSSLKTVAQTMVPSGILTGLKLMARGTYMEWFSDHSKAIESYFRSLDPFNTAVVVELGDPVIRTKARLFEALQSEGDHKNYTYAVDLSCNHSPSITNIEFSEFNLANEPHHQMIKTKTLDNLIIWHLYKGINADNSKILKGRINFNEFDSYEDYLKSVGDENTAFRNLRNELPNSNIVQMLNIELRNSTNGSVKEKGQLHNLRAEKYFYYLKEYWKQ